MINIPFLPTFPSQDESSHIINNLLIKSEMNANPPKSSPCRTCCSILIIFTTILFLIFDFVNIANLSDVNANIDRMSSSYVSCQEACGTFYVSYNSRCCLYNNYNYCLDLYSCVRDQLSSLQTQHDNLVSNIWIFSIISICLIIVYCFTSQALCSKPPNQVNVQNPLYNPLNANINRSQDSGNRRDKRIDANYESFAYYDDKNHCCICLQEFKNQKAILLKCGHIFHSLCIRDWAVKQQNCPVCRSSQ